MEDWFIVDGKWKEMQNNVNGKDLQIRKKWDYISAKILYRNLMFSMVISVLVRALFYDKCKEYTLNWFIEINKEQMKNYRLNSLNGGFYK